MGICLSPTYTLPNTSPIYTYQLHKLPHLTPNLIHTPVTSQTCTCNCTCSNHTANNSHTHPHRTDYTHTHTHTCSLLFPPTLHTHPGIVNHTHHTPMSKDEIPKHSSTSSPGLTAYPNLKVYERRVHPHGSGTRQAPVILQQALCMGRLHTGLGGPGGRR